MQNLMITWTGASGSRYTGQTLPIGTEFRPLSGVYIACKAIPQGWFALYVGETQDLFQRLNAGLEGHDGIKRARAFGATHFSIHLVSGNAERLRVETDLRHGLNPSCNLQPVSAFGLSLFRK